MMRAVHVPLSFIVGYIWAIFFPYRPGLTHWGGIISRLSEKQWGNG